MEDKRFWEIVDRFQWGNTDVTDEQREEVTKDLLYTLSLKDIEDLRNTYGEKLAEVDKASGVDYCFDSWSDCKAHIVGLGKKEFLRNIQNPKLILDRLESNDFRESFSYVLPYGGDVVKLTHFYYERLSVEYAHDVQSLIEDEDLSHEVRMKGHAVMHVLELIGGMDYREAVQTYEDELPEYDDRFWWEHLHHGIPNLIRTVKRYML